MTNQRHDKWQSEAGGAFQAHNVKGVILYRFGHFTLSPGQRLLLREGRAVPLIPRYFDLLVLLVEQRHEAVHRRDIFDRVWTDVVVSDSALSQAVRTIRRALEDDSREPRFIRTVSRHGYRFVYPDVVTEDTDLRAAGVPTSAARLRTDPPANEFEPLLQRLTSQGANDEDRRDPAEQLHGLGTAEALALLGRRPGHAAARALLHDARWEAPYAGPVPILGAPAVFQVAVALVRLRLRRAARLAATRCASASIGGGLAGVGAGAAGGLVLAAAPDSAAPLTIAAVLAVIGGACGSLGGVGVGAGLSLAEASVRARREVSLIAGAALGGGIVGLAVQMFGRWTLAALMGLNISVGGGVEGLLIGGAAGAGYAIATRRVHDGMAAPRGRRRVLAAALTAAMCGMAGLVLAQAERPLVGVTIHQIADAADGSRATMAPLGKLIGEPDFGPVSRLIAAFGETAMFGFGLAWGLTRRPQVLRDAPIRRS